MPQAFYFYWFISSNQVFKSILHQTAFPAVYSALPVIPVSDYHFTEPVVFILHQYLKHLLLYSILSMSAFQCWVQSVCKKDFTWKVTLISLSLQPLEYVSLTMEHNHVRCHFKVSFQCFWTCQFHFVCHVSIPISLTCEEKL